MYIIHSSEDFHSPCVNHRDEQLALINAITL
jgi:hypothetical protein